MPQKVDLNIWVIAHVFENLVKAINSLQEKCTIVNTVNYPRVPK